MRADNDRETPKTPTGLSFILSKGRQTVVLLAQRGGGVTGWFFVVCETVNNGL